MPARPPVPNVFKIAIQGTVGSFNWAVILHATWSGTTPSAAACNGLASIIDATWGTSMASLYLSNVVMNTVTFTDLTSITGASGSASTGHAGGASGTAIGGNTAVLVSYPSSFRYRGGHPRTYLPPPPAASLTSASNLTGAAITSFGTGWAAILADLVGSSSAGTTLTQQCAVSYFSGKVARTTPVVMPISSFTIQPKLASQRRRIGRK